MHSAMSDAALPGAEYNNVAMPGSDLSHTVPLALAPAALPVPAPADESDAPSSTLSSAPASRQFSIRRRPSIATETINSTLGAEMPTPLPAAPSATVTSSTPRQISLSRRPSITAASGTAPAAKTSSSQPSSRVSSRAPSPAPVAPINNVLPAVAPVSAAASATAPAASDSSSLTSAAMANAMALVLADGERRKIVLTRTRRPSVQSEQVVNAAPIDEARSHDANAPTTAIAITTVSAAADENAIPAVGGSDVLAGLLSPPAQPQSHGSTQDSSAPLVLECVSTLLELGGSNGDGHAASDFFEHSVLTGPSDAEMKTPRRALFVSADRVVDAAVATSHATAPVSEPDGNLTTVTASDSVTSSDNATAAQASPAPSSASLGDFSLLSPAPAFDHPQFFSGQLPTPAAADRRMEAEVAAATAAAAAKEAAKAAAEAEASAHAEALVLAAKAKRDQEEVKARAVAAPPPAVTLLPAALVWTVDSEQSACFHCAVAFSLLNRYGGQYT